MSRAFVKEESSEPPLLVPRAHLPVGVSNYVTRRGLALLREERSALEMTRPAGTGATEAGAATELAAYHARLAALDARIASALLVDPATLPQDQVRFSASVTVRSADGSERRYQIVGVDEADAAAGRIAFTAPLARALSGKRVGDVITLQRAQGDEELEISGLDYARE